MSTIHQAKLAELQDLVMRLVAERNDWYSRYTGAMSGVGTVNPDLLPVGEDHAHAEHQAHTHTELNADSGAGKLQLESIRNQLHTSLFSRGCSRGEVCCERDVCIQQELFLLVDCFYMDV